MQGLYVWMHNHYSFALTHHEQLRDDKGCLDRGHASSGYEDHMSKSFCSLIVCDESLGHVARRSSVKSSYMAVLDSPSGNIAEVRNKPRI